MERRMSHSEQAHRLLEELRHAVIVNEIPDEPAARPARELQQEERRPQRHGVFVTLFWIVFNGLRRVCGYSLPPRYGDSPWKQKAGVPHGVVDAVVLAENVHVEVCNGKTEVRFCHSHSYLALKSTVRGGDYEEYSPPDQTNIAVEDAILPTRTGDYRALMLVSLNGENNVKVQAFLPQPPTSNRNQPVVAVCA